MDPILTVLCDQLYLFFYSPVKIETCQDQTVSEKFAIRQRNKLAFTSTIICDMTCKHDRAD